MKIKIEPITNSSSVSFCIWGITTSYLLPESVLKRIYEKYLDSIQNKSKLSYKNFKRKETILHYFEKLCNKNNLKVILSPHSNILYVGRELSLMKDDETFSEFKKSINDILSLLGFDSYNSELIIGYMT